MIDIYSIPLYYISFDKNLDLEKQARDCNFTNIHHFKAVNGKQFNEEKLLEDKLITYRTYGDLTEGRDQHQGMPSLGGIGCALSHYSLWKLCVDNNYPYIIIVEDDISFRKLSTQEIDVITDTISKPNGIYISPLSKFKIKNKQKFWGLHFYICSQSVCRKMMENFFPIDVQVDSYLSYVFDKDKTINLKLYKTLNQKEFYKNKSNIQESFINFCTKCFLPSNNIFYLGFIVLIIILVILCIYFYKKRCK